jgi:hypothetical protein
MTRLQQWQIEVRKMRKRLKVRYLPRIPRKIPEGRVLMHNHVRHGKTTQTGINGFRAWTAIKPYPDFVLCRCGWSGLEHYASKEHAKIYRGSAS